MSSLDEATIRLSWIYETDSAPVSQGCDLFTTTVLINGPGARAAAKQASLPMMGADYTSPCAGQIGSGSKENHYRRGDDGTRVNTSIDYKCPK